MVVVFYPRAASGGISTDPGEENVLAPSDGGPSSYSINGVSHTGTLTLDAPTAAAVADAVWSRSVSGYTDVGTFGGFVRTLLTLGKFLGLK